MVAAGLPARDRRRRRVTAGTLDLGAMHVVGGTLFEDVLPRQLSSWTSSWVRPDIA
jgi:hypothetical protein